MNVSKTLKIWMLRISNPTFTSSLQSAAPLALCPSKSRWLDQCITIVPLDWYLITSSTDLHKNIRFCFWSPVNHAHPSRERAAFLLCTPVLLYIRQVTLCLQGMPSLCVKVTASQRSESLNDRFRFNEHLWRTFDSRARCLLLAL